MLSLFLGFLTVVLVLNCIVLILLILIQLPKKEAGIGMAFGGAATETLFGAGSGTVLTKVTKYAAALFLGLSLLLSILGSHSIRQDRTSLDAELQRRVGSPGAAAPAVTSTPPTAVVANPPSTSAVPAIQLTSTNAPAAPTTPPE